MKSATCLLCLCLIAGQVNGETTNAPPKAAALLCLVVGCTAVGGWMVFKVWHCTPTQGQLTDIQLQQSVDSGRTWTVVDEKIVLLDGTPTEYFRQQLDTAKNTVLYRVRAFRV